MEQLCQLDAFTAREIFARYEQTPTDDRCDIPVEIWRILQWFVTNQDLIPFAACQDLSILVNAAVENWETDPVIASQ